MSTPGQKTDNNQEFSQQTAQAAIEIAGLPETYERELHRTGDHETALKAMIESAPNDQQNNINLLRMDNTTAVTVYDADKRSLTITVDPTLSKGTVFNNADKWDNFNRGQEPHSLGGEVHGGLYDDLIKDASGQLPGDNMIDVLTGIIHDCSSRHGSDLKVKFVGFSKGGAQTALAAGEVISTGLFEDNPNIKLNDIYTFGTPGYGTLEYIGLLNEKIDELGANAWSVELHGDPVPTVLTQDGSSYFTKYEYAQMGNHAYLTSNQGGMEAHINADHAKLTELRSQEAPEGSQHNNSSYTNAIKNIDNNASEEIMDMKKAHIAPSALDI
jgi:hypothetical protein